MNKEFDFNQKLNCLTESEQKLLMKYFDGECGALQNWSVSKKLNSNTKWSQDALQFLAELEDLSNISKQELTADFNFDKSVLEATFDKKVGVCWDEIEAKIKLEESLACVTKADLASLPKFINRIIVDPLVKIFSLNPLLENSASFASSLKLNKLLEKISWASIGSLATASIALFAINIGLADRNIANTNNKDNSESNNSAYNTASQNTANLPSLASNDIAPISYPPVNYQRQAEGEVSPSRQNYELQRQLRNRLARPSVNIDWIKTDKSVHLISAPRERSPIIWIKKGAGQSKAEEEAHDKPSTPESYYLKNNPDDQQFFAVERVYGKNFDASRFYTNQSFSLNNTDGNFADNNFRKGLSFEGYK